MAFANMLAMPAGMMAAAQGANEMMGMQQQPRQQFQPKRVPTGFLNTLGQIGDVLAVMGGRNPVYQPWRQQRETQNAFGQWAANPDDQGAFENFLGADPMTAWKMRSDREQSQMERDKLAIARRKAEIDAAHAAKTPFMRDAEAAGALPGTPEYRRLLEARYNQMRLYGNPEGGYTPDPNWRPVFPDSAEAPRAPERDGPVRVQTPDDARRLAPGTLFMTPDGRTKRVPGGAPQAGARPFP